MKGQVTITQICNKENTGTFAGDINFLLWTLTNKCGAQLIDHDVNKKRFKVIFDGHKESSSFTYVESK